MNAARWIPLYALLAGCRSAPAEPTALVAEVRLLGRNAAGYDAVLVEVKDLLVTSGARQLPVTPGQTRIDLTRPEEAWLVGTVAIPQGVDPIHVALRLDDFGGYQTTQAAGSIDARTAPIELDVARAELAGRKMATVRLDVGASLIDAGEGTRLLLPRLDLVF
jgi:hypothetical protein